MQLKQKRGESFMDLFFSNPDNEVQKHIDEYNIKYFKILSIVFCAIQFLYFCLSFTPYFDVPERLWYIILYGVNVALTLFFFASINLFYLKNNKKATWVRDMQAVIVVLVTAVTILISSLDFKYGGDCIVYCSIVLALTTLTLQSPFQAALFHFLAGSFYLILWNLYKGSMDLGYTFKFFMFIVLCFATGVTKYKIFVKGTKAQIKLLKVSEEFRKSSLTDDLTGVKNRRAFLEDSYTFCEEKSFFLFTDIDYFKKVNDSYGHQNGDFVIKYYSNVLCELFGKEHVYRFGGDEFMVVVPKINKSETDKALKKLQTSLHDVVFDNESHSFSVSGGYLFCKAGSKDLLFKIEDKLMKLDRALYEVKNSGRGYFLQA